jgi:hypothetical protein
LDQKLFFVKDFVKDFVVRTFDLFYGVEFALFAVFDLPHFSEAALADHVVKPEVVLAHSCKKKVSE